MPKLIMNIMSSCNDGIAELLLPQMASLAATNSRYDLRFFLFHTDISAEKIALIKNFAKSVDISFFEVKIEDTAPYDEIAKLGGRWPREAYYTIGLQDFLPSDMDRIVYIDTGDNYINGDLGRLYFADFEDKAIIAHVYNFDVKKDGGGYFAAEYTADDLSDPDKMIKILRGVINSGVVVYNLEKIRVSDYTIENFTELSRSLHISDDMSYFGDQGILSAAYLDDINYYGFPRCITFERDSEDKITRAMNYLSPYNFTAASMNSEDVSFDFEPVIIHFDFPEWKPWKPSFSEKQFSEISSPGYTDNIPFLRTMADFQAKYWDYARLTPIYEELRARAMKHCKAIDK